MAGPVEAAAVEVIDGAARVVSASVPIPAKADGTEMAATMASAPSAMSARPVVRDDDMAWLLLRPEVSGSTPPKPNANGKRIERSRHGIATILL
jgi:hypothetical protein